MLLVGLGYRKRSGKDTLAALLQRYVKDSIIIHFADSLKDEVAEVCEVTRDEIETHKDIFRPMLQWWGTEFRRQFRGADDYWIQRVDEKVAYYKSAGAKMVFVPDTRFINEAKYIKSQGGIIIKVDRPSLPCGDSHSSETEMNNYGPWDFTITNDQGLEELSAKAYVQAEKLMRMAL